MGLKSNTNMLYGHVETPEERVDHMIQIRDLQDETGGILNFILLPYPAFELCPESSGRKLLDGPSCQSLLDLSDTACGPDDIVMAR